jgi:hypothetical protein
MATKRNHNPNSYLYAHRGKKSKNYKRGQITGRYNENSFTVKIAKKNKYQPVWIARKKSFGFLS